MKFAVITNDLQFAAANKNARRKKVVDIFLPKQISFLKSMRLIGIPIIHLQLVVPDDDARSQGRPDDKVFLRGSKGSQILKEVYEPTDYIIEKPKDSGFFETKLNDTLNKIGINTLIITGMQTQICVQTTAADAYFRGYKVYIPSDMVVSTKIGDTKRSLKWMADYCASVLVSKDIVKLVKNNN